MALRYYRNGQATSLSAAVTAFDTSLEVDQASGFPTQFPYTLILDPDTLLEEVVDVSAASGTTLTVARGVDGTTANSHAAGAVVYHGVSARDHAEANSHVNATSGVHGTTGAIVDTVSDQTISGNKTFSGTLATSGGAVVAVGGTQTVSGDKTFSGLLATTAGGAVETLGGSQTVTGNKTWTGAEIHQGTESHSGAETHTGVESHAGAATFTAPVTIEGSVVHPTIHRFATSDIPAPINAVWGNVSGFSFNAVAGAKYAIDCELFILTPASSGVDIRFGWIWTGTGRMSSGQSGLDINQDAPVYNGAYTAHALVGDTDGTLDEGTGLGTPAGLPVIARVAATFTCIADSVVNLRFRQDVSNALQTPSVQDGSRMRVERIS